MSVEGEEVSAAEVSGSDPGRRSTAERFFRAAEQGDLAVLHALVAERPELVRLERAAAP